MGRSKSVQAGIHIIPGVQLVPYKSMKIFVVSRQKVENLEMSIFPKHEIAIKIVRIFRIKDTSTLVA